MQLGDCSHLRKLAETLNWQQRALLEHSLSAAARNSVVAERAAESP
jgi:hypothetical protein